MIVIVIVIVIVTGGKQSQLLAFALGLGWSLTKILNNVFVTCKYTQNNVLC